MTEKSSVEESKNNQLFTRQTPGSPRPHTRFRFVRAATRRAAYGGEVPEHWESADATTDKERSQIPIRAASVRIWFYDPP